MAALPGVVKHSVALPDVHSGYGFAIGNVAAMDTADPEAVVSPGGVRMPVSPSRTTSGTPAVFSLMTGRPAACASSAARP